MRFLAGPLGHHLSFRVWNRLSCWGSKSTMPHFHTLAVCYSMTLLLWLEGLELSFIQRTCLSPPSRAVYHDLASKQSSLAPRGLSRWPWLRHLLPCPPSLRSLRAASVLPCMALPFPWPRLHLAESQTASPQPPVVSRQPKLTSNPRLEGRRQLVTAAPGPVREGNWQQGLKVQCKRVQKQPLQTLPQESLEKHVTVSWPRLLCL